MNNFKERIYEIAFGDDAINKDYTDEEVIERIQKYSNQALEYESIIDYFEDNADRRIHL